MRATTLFLTAFAMTGAALAAPVAGAPAFTFKATAIAECAFDEEASNWYVTQGFHSFAQANTAVSAAWLLEAYGVTESDALGDGSGSAQPYSDTDEAITPTENLAQVDFDYGPEYIPFKGKVRTDTWAAAHPLLNATPFPNHMGYRYNETKSDSCLFDETADDTGLGDSLLLCFPEDELAYEGVWTGRIYKSSEGDGDSYHTFAVLTNEAGGTTTFRWTNAAIFASDGRDMGTTTASLPSDAAWHRDVLYVNTDLLCSLSTARNTIL